MTRIGILPALLTFLMGFFSTALANGQVPTGEPDAEINQALRSREYQRAIELIDSALAAADESAREHLLFRRGLALLYDNRHQEAIAQFDEQLKQFPGGAWAHKARFRKADAHVARKQFEAAERIYAARVRALVGDERKSEVAQVYLGFAEEYFEPSDTLTKPDYTKARTFYERALELEPGEQLRDRISYRRALCTQKLGQWGDAAGQYEQYLLVFDDTYRELRKLRNVGLPLPSAASQPGRHLIPARVGLGECRLAAGDLIGARRAWQDLLTLLDQVDPDRRQQREPWITATYLLSKTYQLPQPPNTESLTLGVQTLEKLLRAFPSSKQAIQAAHDIAKAYAHLGRHDEAIAAYRALINRDVIDPADDDTRKLAETLSQDALFSIGRLYFAQKKYTDAIAAWNEYVGKYPTGPHWSASQQAIVDAEYQVGADAVADERYDDARQAWTAFLQKYPLDARAPAILYMFGDLAYREQQQREKAGEAPNWFEPITHWRRLVNKFPNTEQSGQAQFRIGQTFEEKIKDLETAIEAYRKLTWSQWAERARQRVAEMNATRLLLVTARIFRTDEPAEVRVDLRNIDRLTVKLYRIDMEDYFRKSHSLRGVEALDLLLIDPDKTLEIEVAGYAKYKPITQQLDIPFEGAGVYAVNVSNESTKLTAPGGGPPRKLEATTLLIRSDIDVIIKSSRRQVFVFAQDMRTQAPAAGVNVLVSDGSKVLLSGKTDADGVWLGKDKKLKDLENLAVFAERDGHIAGNALSLHGLEFSTGLSPRGYIYADRPAYRPGQAVNIRGILREVKDEQYSLPTQPDDQRLRWTLDVVDAKGRVLHTEELRLSEYGSFATQFRVPTDAPVGQYKLIARRPGGPTFTGTFDVQTYQLAKAYLRFEFDEHVVMRGEPIKGSIVIQYHYGEPVAGKTVEYAMHDPFTGEEIHRSGVTDKDGKVAFEFDSTSLPEEAGVGFSARQADLGIEAGGTVYVAVRAFRAKVKTPRPLYLSEEPVEVTVETKDLKGEPLAQEMTLTAFLRTYTRGRRLQREQAQQAQQAAQAAGPMTWAETKITSVEVKTDAKTGRGRASLKLTKGGTYVLRAEGKDRFDHTISAEAVVQVSDDKDKTRIRIFTDRQHYKVGEAIALDIHSRLGVAADGSSADPNPERKRGADPSRDRKGAAHLALITYEGEEIIGYRTLKLAPGHNRFDLPVEHGHFPNFAVTVSVMEDSRGRHRNTADTAVPPGKLHTAAREFTVERQLSITLKPDKETYRPRDEMTVEIAVTDQQGKPVEAEVGLAMIDNALLSRFPDRTPDIVAFFNEGAYRRAAMRTETSCAFRYQARTRGMLTELLAEGQRLEEERERYARAVRTRMEAPPRAPAAPDAARVRTFELRHADAGEVAQALNDLFSSRAGARRRGARAGGQFSVSAEDRTNSLIVAGPPDVMGQVEELVRELDTTQSVPQSGIALGYAPRRGRAAGLFGGQAIEMLEGVRGGGAGGRFAPPRQPGQYILGVPLSEQTEWFSLYGMDRKQVVQHFADRIAAGKRITAGLDKTYRDLALADTPEIGWTISRRLTALIQDAPPRTYFPEVAYWNPRITTDADGTAAVKIVMPDSSTKWQLVARGVTRETLCGSGKADVLAKHDFFVELLTPPTFMEGDKSRPLARVHCLTPYTGKIDVELKGEKLATQKRTIDVDGTGVFDVEFDAIEIKETGELSLEVTAETQTEVPDAKRRLADVVTRAIPVRPWGMRIETHAAGVGTDTDFVELELPKPPGEGGEYHDLRLTVAVGPGMQRWLIEEALERGPRWEFIERSLKGWRATPPRTHADSASALLGCLYAADYLRWQEGNEATRRRGNEGERWARSFAALRMTGLGGGGTADVRLLNDRAAGLIAQLLAAQNDDGGWPWCGQGGGEGNEATRQRGNESDPWMTAHVAWALGKARHDGHPIAEQPLKTLTAYLNKAFADARPTQTELKAVVLYGVSWVASEEGNQATRQRGNEVEYAHANRLYRNRQSLSNAALGHLALTFVRLDRKSIAVELLGVLEHRMREIRRGVKTCRMLSGDDSSAWMNSELEVTALALLAQLSVDPRAASVRPMVDYLVSAARADGWRPHKAKGTVIAALATYYGRAEQERADYTLAVSVNGREVRKLTSDDAGSIRIDLSQADLEPHKQRVDFAFAGRGEYAYAVTLSGFSRRFPHPDRVPKDVLRVYGREVSPPALEYKGRVVPAGFSVARDYNWFRNGTANQPVGAVIPVGVRVRRYDRSENAAGDRDYVVVQEIIPAGCRLLTETINGNHLAYDYTDHVLTLYYGSRRSVDWLRYQMVATTPGTYRIPSTIARSLYRPSVMHLNLDDQILTVLPRGTKSPDEYRMTPDELYNFGRLYYDDGDYEAAAKSLTQLIEGKWVLREEPYRESIRMLLTAALKREDAEGTVNYFEILKEKYPDLVIPFARIVQVADAYARTGQHERAYLIYRATADASFVRDSSVGGVLQDEGRFLESIDFLEDLWREYPDTPQVESIYYALSQTLYAQAENAGLVRPRSASTERGAGRVTRADIIGEAIRLLEGFLALYPESPIADEASYSLANAYLDLDDFKTVLDRTAESIELFPESKWLDRYRYIQALAYFHLGNFEHARELAEQVAAATFRDEQGLVRPSPNKWLALYIIGQIYHAQNQTAKAIEYYNKVKSHFSDAQEAVGYFEHKFVELPEVTVFHPDADGFREAGEWAKRLRAAEETAGGGPAGAPSAPAYPKPFVQLGYRNIKSAVLQVYRVDLMKLALIEKNLSQITSVNLAGVKPILEKTIPLGDGHDYVDKSVRVELNVTRPQQEAEATAEEGVDEQAGAYLVICRGDDLFSSGLVLITPLTLEVQEDLASQRVRVNVVDAIARGGLKNVHVKVIGTGMDRFVSGETDLRGVYVADAVGGYPTAIARDADGHFAFYRSEGALLAMAGLAEARVEMAAEKEPLQRTKAEYRKHLLMENTAIQESNTVKLKGMFKQQQKGVQVQQAE